MMDLFCRLLDEAYGACFMFAWFILGMRRVPTKHKLHLMDERENQWINASAWTTRFSDWEKVEAPFRRCFEFGVASPRENFRLTGLHDA